MPNIKHGIYQGIKTTVIEDKQQIISSARIIQYLPLYPLDLS